MSNSPNQSGEFDLIARYFQNWPKFSNTQIKTIVPNGDDCLVIQSLSPIAVSVDSIVENVHFLTSSPAHGVGYRALATAVSDLVAMGATPSFFTLALTFNKNEEWLKLFSDGLKQAANDFKIDLQGGDTTHCKKTSKNTSVITVQVHGECLNPIKRSTAKIGDLICVTGNLGDAAAAVLLLETKNINKTQQTLLNAFYYPKPPIHLSKQLSTKANSAIDISDGLLADLMHICNKSQLQAKIDRTKIPLSSALKQTTTAEQALKFALTGGDDYQVCFTIDRSQLDWIKQNNIFVIGEMFNGVVDILDEHNQSFTEHYASLGYQHF